LSADRQIFPDTSVAGRCRPRITADKGMDNEFDNVDFEYATTIADRANRLMTANAVPPTPNNFSVWFHYAMGAAPSLRKTIDILLENKRSFDSAINRDLYVNMSTRSRRARRLRIFPKSCRA